MFYHPIVNGCNIRSSCYNWSNRFTAVCGTHRVLLLSKQQRNHVDSTVFTFLYVFIRPKQFLSGWPWVVLQQLDTKSSVVQLFFAGWPWVVLSQPQSLAASLCRVWWMGSIQRNDRMTRTQKYLHHSVNKEELLCQLSPHHYPLICKKWNVFNFWHLLFGHDVVCDGVPQCLCCADWVSWVVLQGTCELAAVKVENEWREKCKCKNKLKSTAKRQLYPALCLSHLTGRLQTQTDSTDHAQNFGCAILHSNNSSINWLNLRGDVGNVSARGVRPDFL